MVCVYNLTPKNRRRGPGDRSARIIEQVSTTGLTSSLLASLATLRVHFHLDLLDGNVGRAETDAVPLGQHRIKPLGKQSFQQRPTLSQGQLPFNLEELVPLDRNLESCDLELMAATAAIRNRALRLPSVHCPARNHPLERAPDCK